MYAKTHTSIRIETRDIILLHAMDSVPTNMMPTQFYGNNCTLPTATGSSKLPITTRFLRWVAKGNVQHFSAHELQYLFQESMTFVELKLKAVASVRVKARE